MLQSLFLLDAVTSLALKWNLRSVYCCANNNNNNAMSGSVILSLNVILKQGESCLLVVPAEPAMMVCGYGLHLQSRFFGSQCEF